MRAAAALPALLALLALPAVSACSWAPVSPLQEPAWHGGTLDAATGIFWRGPVDLDAGRARAAYPSEALLGPDGASFVFPRAGPDVQAGPTRYADSCGFHLPRHLVAYDAGTGAFRMVDEGPLWAIAADDEGVRAMGARATRVYAWGTWALLRVEPADARVEALHWRGVIDAQARPALGADVARSAWSPDGTHVAIVRFHGGEGGLEVLRASDRAVVASAPASPYAGLGWGAGGLFVAGGANATLVVYPDAPDLASPRVLSWEGATRVDAAWAPDGRLAVTMPTGAASARVVVLDASLAPLVDRNVTVEAFDEAAWWARVAAEVPMPEYSTLTKVRETPAPALLAVGALAVALCVRGFTRRRG